MRPSTLPIVLGLIGLSAARTDLGGCVSSKTTNQWHEASMIWYVPESGEICDIPDCGGGRAPPKTDQPGCAAYSGTATLTPSYLPGYGPSGKMAATTSTLSETTSSSTHSTETTEATSTTSASARSMVTSAPTTSPVVSMSTKISKGSVAGSSSSKGSVAGSSSSKGSAAGSSTSSAPGSSSTANAAANSVSNMAGALAGVAAVIGAIAL